MVTVCHIIKISNLLGESVLGCDLLCLYMLEFDGEGAFQLIPQPTLVTCLVSQARAARLHSQDWCAEAKASKR